MQTITESYNLITPATESTITVEEARLQLRNEDDTERIDESLIQSLCFAADRMAENKTGRALMQATYEYAADSWPCHGVIKLWPGNLVAVASVNYRDSDNVEQTLVEGTDYEVNKRSMPGRVIMINMPSLKCRHDAIVITYTVGHGAADVEAEAQRALVPEDIKSWMKLQLATLYENRQLFTEGMSLQSIQTYSDLLIYPYLL
jgi:uncharacterized phiE125 gp8 family phage protein